MPYSIRPTTRTRVVGSRTGAIQASATNPLWVFRPKREPTRKSGGLGASLTRQRFPLFLPAGVEFFSAYSGSASILLFAAAVLGNLYGTGMLQALYCITMPLALMSCMDILEVWVDTLPSQVRADKEAPMYVRMAGVREHITFWGEFPRV